MERKINYFIFLFYFKSGGHKFESPALQELGALIKKIGKTLGGRSFFNGDPDVIT
jgi:hypothetical protein